MLCLHPLGLMYETPENDDDDGCGAFDGANNFVLHHGLVTMVQANQFSRRPNADSNSHLKSFIDVSDTIRINQVSKDIITLKLFTFSLNGSIKPLRQTLTNPPLKNS